MQIFRSSAVGVALAALLITAAPGRAQTPQPVEIPAILSITGGNAVVGAGEAQVMRDRRDAGE